MLKRLSDSRFVAAVLGAYLLLGGIGGLVWRLWWHAPRGMVLSHHWVPGVVSAADGSLYPLADPPQDIAAASAEWAVIALVIGLLGGLVVVLGARGREYLSLALTLIGGAGAGLVMCGVGYLHRGADPRTLAEALPDGVMLSDRLALAEPWLVALPLVMSGAVVAVSFLGWATRPVVAEPEKVVEAV